LGISIEQVRHYETGFHRIGAGRLYAIAKLLCVDVSWFFEGAPGAPVVPASERAPVLSGPLLALCQDRGAVALLRAFNAIEDQGLRASIAALVGATAAAGETVH
jgi:transcriptional regulator with XRE-family HTH domain